MLIFCTGLRSSASTLQWQITKHIVEAEGLGFGFVVNSGNTIDKYLRTSQLIVVKQHKVARLAYLQNSDAQILTTVRDLRDVCCSLMQRWHCKFNVAFDKLKVYTEQQHAWTQFKHYCACYEQFTTDIEQATIDIANYLQLEVSDNLPSEIATKYSLENNRQRLTNQHITDAQIGKYQLRLTTNQIIQLETEFYWWFKNYDYKLLYC